MNWGRRGESLSDVMADFENTVDYEIGLLERECENIVKDMDRNASFEDNLVNMERVQDDIATKLTHLRNVILG